MGNADSKPEPKVERSDKKRRSTKKGSAGSTKKGSEGRQVKSSIVINEEMKKEYGINDNENIQNENTPTPTPDDLKSPNSTSKKNLAFLKNLKNDKSNKNLLSIPEVDPQNDNHSDRKTGDKSEKKSMHTESNGGETDEEDEDSIELFKPKKKEFIQNDFLGLDDYVTYNKPEYFIKNMLEYEKNLEEEKTKITEIYANIFTTSNGTEIKSIVHDDIKNEVNKKIKNPNLLGKIYTSDQLDKLDINSDDFYLELASRLNLSQRRAYAFKERFFNGSS